MKSITIASIVALFATPAIAETMTVVYPAKLCTEIVGSDFSSPGGDSSRYTFELMCKDETGAYRIFMTNWMTGSSFLGFSRAATPDVIRLVPSENSAGISIR